VDEKPDEDGQVYPLAYNVRSFNLRYLDPQSNEWSDEWDTRSSETPYRLPRAVEIGLVLVAPDPDDERRSIDVPFMTTVLLNYGGRLLNTGNPMANQGGQSLFGGIGNPLMPSPLNASGMSPGTGSVAPANNRTPGTKSGTPGRAPPRGAGRSGATRMSPGSKR
jgi:hypothetical protein